MYHDLFARWWPTAYVWCTLFPLPLLKNNLGPTVVWSYYESMPTIRTKKPSQGTVFFFSIEDPTIIQQKGHVFETITWEQTGTTWTRPESLFWTPRLFSSPLLHQLQKYIWQYTTLVEVHWVEWFSDQTLDKNMSLSHTNAFYTRLASPHCSPHTLPSLPFPQLIPQ